MSKGQVDTRKSRDYHKTPQRKARVREYNKSPRGRYQAHKLNAKTRGIEFSLTFEEWWDLWKPKWDQRGRGKGKFHMCRKGDIGPYEVGNVYLAEHSQNTARDKRKAIGVQGRQLPCDEIQKIIELRKLGVMIYRIAEHIGCSRSTVRRYLAHEGVK